MDLLKKISVFLALMPAIAMSQYSGNFSIDELKQDEYLRYESQTPHANVGHSVNAGGDVNGDGFEDFIIGVNSNDIEFGAFVIFGGLNNVTEVTDLDSLDGTNGFKVKSNDVEDYLGFAVSQIGDINSDGIDDIIIGSHMINHMQSSVGGAYVIFGSTQAFPAELNVSQLNGLNGYKIIGYQADSKLGFSVSGAGDFNNDGTQDFMIGAPYFDTPETDAGSVFVVFGHQGPYAAEFNLSDLNGHNGFRIDGEVSADQFGGSISSAGDFNGDGIEDLVLGAILNDRNGDRSGASYIIFGTSQIMLAEFNTDQLTGLNGIAIAGASDFDRSGYSVRNCGDINEDGHDDVLIGAPAAESLSIRPGAAYLVYGQEGFIHVDQDLTFSNELDGLKITGEFISQDLFGWPTSCDFDFNGDGVNDIVLGAPFYDKDDQNNTGIIYVLYGKSTQMFNDVINVSQLDSAQGFSVSGESAGSEFSVSVSGLQDINSDGVDDLVIGARKLNNAGGAYVLLGNDTIFRGSF